MSTISKLEIDVLQSNELKEASDIAFKYSLPAIVVHQDLINDAMIYRGRIQGKYKLILPIDWPKGEKYGNLKLRDIPIDTFEADGYEILITPNKAFDEIVNELNLVTLFFRQYFQPDIEIRFVLGCYSRKLEYVKSSCEALRKIPLPNMVRTDIPIKNNRTDISEYLETIKSNISVPIKLSGNITDLKSTTTYKNISRIAANLTTTKALINEFYQQPPGLQKLLKQ